MRAISLSVLPVALASTQVYLSPGPTETLPVVSTSEDARGLVSHHLGLSRFAQASTLQFSDALQTVLNSGDPFQHTDSRDSLLVLFQGPAEVIPQQLKPSLLVEDSPEQEVQWEDYLKGLLQRSAAWLQYEVQGLGQLWREAVQGLKDVPEVTLPVEPKEAYARLLSDFDFAGPASAPLLKDIEEMSTLVDQAASASTSWALRLAGLGEFEASNSSPEQIAQARALYSQVLKATIEAFKQRTSPNARIALVQTSASESSVKKHTRRHFHRRQLTAAAHNSTPVIPSSKLSFDSYDSCMEQTDGCSSHGSCVTGVSAGQSVYACSCSKADGITWAGERCEKQQVASSFWLLTGTTVLLIVVVGLSVSLLGEAGSEELPQVLSQ